MGHAAAKKLQKFIDWIQYKYVNESLEMSLLKSQTLGEKWENLRQPCPLTIFRFNSFQCALGEFVFEAKAISQWSGIHLHPWGVELRVFCVNWIWHAPGVSQKILLNTWEMVEELDLTSPSPPARHIAPTVDDLVASHARPTPCQLFTKRIPFRKSKVLGKPGPGHGKGDKNRATEEKRQPPAAIRAPITRMKDAKALANCYFMKLQTQSSWIPFAILVPSLTFSLPLLSLAMSQGFFVLVLVLVLVLVWSWQIIVVPVPSDVAIAVAVCCLRIVRQINWTNRAVNIGSSHPARLVESVGEAGRQTYNWFGNSSSKIFELPTNNVESGGVDRVVGVRTVRGVTEWAKSGKETAKALEQLAKQNPLFAPNTTKKEHPSLPKKNFRPLFL